MKAFFLTLLAILATFMAAFPATTRGQESHDTIATNADGTPNYQDLNAVKMMPEDVVKRATTPFPTPTKRDIATQPTPFGPKDTCLIDCQGDYIKSYIDGRNMPIVLPAPYDDDDVTIMEGSSNQDTDLSRSTTASRSEVVSPEVPLALQYFNGTITEDCCAKGSKCTAGLVVGEDDMCKRNCNCTLDPRFPPFGDKSTSSIHISDATLPAFLSVNDSKAEFSWWRLSCKTLLRTEDCVRSGTHCDAHGGLETDSEDCKAHCKCWGPRDLEEAVDNSYDTLFVHDHE
ncbi:hypothetical protein BJ170DRAFT_593414 [Xylariales sp. AK1849]|nr:hypothetical protein BJ170DRAFT_593414 [Xylariales sp. AK1849]